MWKLYLKTKIKDASAWIGLAVIISTIFLPHSVTIALGLFLLFTPDSKLNDLISGLARKTNEKL